MCNKIGNAFGIYGSIVFIFIFIFYKNTLTENPGRMLQLSVRALSVRLQINIL